MQDELCPFRGGETEALKRLRESIENKVQGRIMYWSFIRLYTCDIAASCYHEPTFSPLILIILPGSWLPITHVILL